MLVRSFALAKFMVAFCLFVSGVSGQSSDRPEPIKGRKSSNQEQFQSDTLNQRVPDSFANDVTQDVVDAYQDFINKIQATKDRKQQVKILNDATARFNALLAPILLTDKVSDILPLLVRVQLIDIDTSFRKIFGEHPKAKIRAAGLLSFAKHCTNNYRGKVAEETLRMLKKQYGDLDYDEESTFSEAADDALFFVKHLANGQPAPNFAGKDADGTMFDLEDYRGKVVMLRFWGDWCPPCRAMYDFERELVKRYKDDDFALIGVNSDSLDDMKAAQRRSNLTWRSIWDGGDTAGPVATLYQVESWPTIVVIDAEGVIQFRSQGLRQSQLENVIKRCLAKKLAPQN